MVQVGIGNCNFEHATRVHRPFWVRVIFRYHRLFQCRATGIRFLLTPEQENALIFQQRERDADQFQLSPQRS